MGVRAGKGDSKWWWSVGHLPAWSEWPGSPSMEKVGYEREFCTKVKGGKGFLFIENHIFYLNILASAFLFFLYFFTCFDPKELILQRCILCTWDVIFLSYTNPVYFEVHFILSLMTSSVRKTFFFSLHCLLLPSLQALTRCRLEFTQNPFNHPFAFLTLPLRPLPSQSSPVLLFPLLSCEELENIANY